MYEIDKCKQCDCGKANPIVNKFHYLCEAKNKIRLQSKKQPKEKPEVSELKKRYSIRKISNTKRITCHDGQVVTRAELNNKLHLVYQEIDNERERKCEGCWRTDLPLSHSHIISRELRPDLITDKNNIQLHCFGDTYKTCHEKWSRWVVEEVINMLDFERNLEYVEKVDQKLFQKMMAKLEYSDKTI